MSVVRFCFLVIFGPFQDATGFFADADARDSFQGCFALFSEIGIHFQDVSSFDAVCQQVVDDLQVHGGSIGEHRMFPIGQDKCILGRIGRVGDQFPGVRCAGWCLHQEVHDEASRSFHEGPGTLCEKLLVTGEAIVFPGVLCQPCGTHGPYSLGAIGGSSKSPCIGQVVNHPSACPVDDLRTPLPRCDQHIHQIEQGQVHFRQVSEVGRPVVHLKIDVCMKIGVPGGIHLPRPESL